MCSKSSKFWICEEMGSFYSVSFDLILEDFYLGIYHESVKEYKLKSYSDVHFERMYIINFHESKLHVWSP